MRINHTTPVRRALLAWFACVSLAHPVAWNRGEVQEDDLRVGLAAVDITPPVGWRLYGALYEQFSRGVHDPLTAKAVVFRQGNETVALLICDLCFISRKLSEQVRERAGRATDIPSSNIIVCATHTHGGPEYDGVLRDFRHEQAIREKGRDTHEPRDYFAQLTERCVEAIVEAHAALRPARLQVGVAQQPGMAFNRRFHMKDGTVRFNPGKMNPDIVRPAGLTDPDLPFLLMRDAGTSEPLGSLTVFAMHVATFGNGMFGADYPAHLENRLRKQFGDKFISVFGEGTAGDVNHIDVSTSHPQTSDTEPARIGNALAATILKTVSKLESIQRIFISWFKFKLLWTSYRTRQCDSDNLQIKGLSRH